MAHHWLESRSVQCPYCWEVIELLIDCSAAHQDYVEDCSVCCRPIHFVVTIDENDGIELVAKSEDES